VFRRTPASDPALGRPKLSAKVPIGRGLEQDPVDVQDVAGRERSASTSERDRGFHRRHVPENRFGRQVPVGLAKAGAGQAPIRDFETLDP
jgi:hypothetical protein